MSENTLLGSALFSHNYCATDKIISLRVKRSIETNISKKSCFHCGKSFWPIFPRVIGCGKPRETIYEAPRGFFKLTVEVLGPFP